MVRLVKVIKNKPGKSTTYMGDDGQTYTLSGDLAQRANNPGNISPVSKKARERYERDFNVIGYVKSSNGPAVAVFATPEDGQRAQAALWASPRYQNMTLSEAAKHWAASPYVDQLGSAAGVDPRTTKVSDLSPQQMQAITATQTGLEGSRRLSITGGANNAPIARETFFGSTGSSSSASQLALMGNANAGTRGSAALDAINQATGAPPPQPRPGRPAAITGPQAAAPVNSGSIVTLPSGNKIKTGTYPSSNPDHSVVVADDGTGKAVITHPPNQYEVPGFLDPLHEGPDTIAGSIIGPIIRGEAEKASIAAARQVKAAAPGAAQAAVDTAKGAASRAMNYFGTMFGGGDDAAHVRSGNALAAGGAGSGAHATGSATLRAPLYDAPGAGAGSYDELHRALASAASFKPTTTYTKQQMVSDNPAYLNYIAKQKADSIGAGPGSFSELQNALAGPSSAPVPRTITTTRQVAHTAVDEGLRATQQTLANAGYYTGAIDGLYGPKTAAAIAAAQAAAQPAPAPAARQPAPSRPSQPHTNLNSGVSNYLRQSGHNHNGNGGPMTAGEQANAFRRAIF